MKEDQIYEYSSLSIVLFWAKTDTLSLNLKFGEIQNCEVSKDLEEAMNYFLLVYPAFEE